MREWDTFVRKSIGFGGGGAIPPKLPENRSLPPSFKNRLTTQSLFFFFFFSLAPHILLTNHARRSNPPPRPEPYRQPLRASGRFQEKMKARPSPYPLFPVVASQVPKPKPWYRYFAKLNPSQSGSRGGVVVWWWVMMVTIIIISFAPWDVTPPPCLQHTPFSSPPSKLVINFFKTPTMISLQLRGKGRRILFFFKKKTDSLFTTVITHFTSPSSFLLPPSLPCRQIHQIPT